MRRKADLYDALDRLTPSPIVNRYARLGAVSEGLPFFPSVRGDFHFKLGPFAEAQAEFERAATLTRNAREPLLDRARACVGALQQTGPR